MPVDRTVDVERDVSALHNLDLDGLRLRWRNVFGRSAPAHLPKYLLLRLIAFQLQAEVYGDLSRSTVQLLIGLAQEVAAHDDNGSKSVPLPGQGHLRPGTVLVREHDGQQHHVMVADDGFVWNGTTYGSLTKIAHAITGTRWNGPRFFGLRERSKEATH